jgi:hypothetical protein
VSYSVFSRLIGAAALAIAFVVLPAIAGGSVASAQERFYRDCNSGRDRGYRNDDFRDHQRRHSRLQRGHERNEREGHRRYQSEEYYRYRDYDESRRRQQDESQDLRRYQRDESQELRRHQRDESQDLRRHRSLLRLRLGAGLGLL